MLETVQNYIDAKLVHSIHGSGAKSFRGCRRRWNWLMREYYYPKVTPKPLEFGVAFHKGMEVLYSPVLWDKPVLTVVALAQHAFAQECKRQYAKYAENFEIDDEVKADYADRVHLGKGMIAHFAKTVRREDYNQGFRPLAVEVKFEVPLEKNGKQLYCKCDDCYDRWARHPLAMEIIAECERRTHRPCDTRDHFDGRGLPITYGGRLDALAEDEDGLVWIVDWKSAARMIEDRHQFLLLDDQITRYLAALRLCGYEVAGFLYHEIKKAVPDEPEPNKVRRLGCLYSVSKQQNVEYSTYLRVIKDNDYDAYLNGSYDVYLQWLKENEGRFSARYEEKRNATELDKAWEEVILEAEDMTDPDLRIYKNAGRFNCENCAFITPCLVANEGGDVVFALESMFDKKEWHYWEDETVPSTDNPAGVILG